MIIRMEGRSEQCFAPARWMVPEGEHALSHEVRAVVLMQLPPPPQPRLLRATCPDSSPPCIGMRHGLGGGRESARLCVAVTSLGSLPAAKRETQEEHVWWVVLG